MKKRNYFYKLRFDIVDDPRLGMLRPTLKWRYIETLCIAGEYDQGGILPKIKQYAWRVRDEPERVETDFEELVSAGLLSRNRLIFKVTDFQTNQRALTSTERSRASRSRKQAEAAAAAGQQRDDDAAFPSPERDRERDRDRDPEIDPDGDRESYFWGLVSFTTNPDEHPLWMHTPNSFRTNDDFVRAWGSWLRHVTSANITYTEESARAQMIEFEEIGIIRSITALRISVKKAWRTINEPFEQEANKVDQDPTAAEIATAEAENAERESLWQN